MLNEVIVTKINSTYVRIDADEDVLHDINSYFAVYAEGYIFNPRYKARIWDGRIRFFGINNRLLSSGLVPLLEKFCEKHSYTLTYESDFNNFESEFDEQEFKETCDEALKDSGLHLRDYQEEACKLALQKRTGILQCCTSSGKSMIIYCMIKNMLKYKRINKLLLIVPNVSLVEQMRSDFIEYGWKDVDDTVELLYSSKKPTFKLPVLISTWQSLQKIEDKEYYEDIDAVIVDECHGSKANVINTILKQCINTEYRIGTTGTLPTGPADLLNINAVLGNVLYSITSKELIDRGILTRMTVAGILVKYPAQFIAKNKGRSYPEEVKLVESYVARQNVLATILAHTPKEHNVLLLCNHVEHLLNTAAWLTANYPDRNVKVISGNVSAADREDIRKKLESEEGTIIVATYGTCSTGINMPKLHEIILYANSKSKIKVLQSLGRGLRKHNTKNRVILYDIIDDMSYTARTRVIHNYLYQHWKEREKYYKEQEFPIKTMELGV